MTYRKILILFTCIFFLAVNQAVAQPVITNGGTEAEHQQLREMKAVYEDAISHNKLDLLKPMLDENFSFVTFTDSVFDIKKQSFEDFKKDWNDTRNKMLKGGSYSVILDPDVSLIIGDIAIASGTAYHKIVKGDGTTYELPGQFTVVLHRKNNAWKVIRVHSSIKSFDNPLLTDTVKRLVIKTGIAALALGMLVGALLAYLFMRRKTSALA